MSEDLTPILPTRPPGQTRVIPPRDVGRIANTPDWAGSSIIGSSVPGVMPTQAIRTLTVHASSQPLPFVYGKQLIGGEFVYGKSNVGGNLLLVFYVCRGPINAIRDITFNGISYGGLGIGATIYTGTLTQTVDATWSTQLPSHTSGLPGIAYVVLQIPNATGTTSTFDPMKPLFLVEGRKVRDPRLDATLVTRYYTTNAALVTADFATEKLGGCGSADAAVDFSGTVTSAANDCDGGTTRPTSPSLALAGGASATAGALPTGQFYWTYTYVVSGVESLESPAFNSYNAGNPSFDLSAITVGPAGTTARKIYRNKVGTGPSFQRLLVGTIANNVATTFNDGIADAGLGAAAPAAKHTLNVVLRQQAVCSAVIQTLRTQWVGVIAYNNGLYQFFVDKIRSNSGLTFTDDITNAARNMIGAPARHLKLTEEVPSRVEVTFSNAAKNWADDIAISELAGVTTGVYPKIIKKIDARGIDNAPEAQNLADQVRNQGQRDIQTTWTTLFDGLRAQIMDRVTVNSALDGISHDVLITDLRQEGSKFILKGDIYSDSTYP